VKKDALVLFDSELGRKRKKAVLTTGSMSDPYVHIEAELRLMQKALELIAKHGFGISVLTKSDLILRDIDLYKQIDRNLKAVVSLTVTTTDDLLAAKLEPHVARPTRRFEVLGEFARQGISTGIWMSPVLPFLEDTEENVVSIVKAAAKNGVAYIQAFGIGTTMREGSRDYFYSQLCRLFPGLKERYQSAYGQNYICPSPNEKKLLQLFRDACDEFGIIHDQKSINELIYKPKYAQQTLF